MVDIIIKIYIQLFTKKVFNFFGGIVLFYSAGFAINKKIDEPSNKEYSISLNDKTNFLLFQNDNSYLKFSPYDRDLDVLFNTLKKRYGLTNILLCGRFFINNEFNKKIDFAFKQLVCNNDYSFFKDVEGNYIVAIESNEMLWVYNSQCSEYMAFWYFSGNQIKISNYHNFISESINDSLLTLLCYGDKLNIFNDLNVLTKNSVLMINYKTKQCSIILNAIKPDIVLSGNESLEEVGEMIYYSLLNSTRQRLKGYNKVSLLLSGGIDSAAVARCLADLNANVICYTWSSKNERLSEYQYSKEVGQALGIEVLEIKFDEAPNNFIFPKLTSIYPFEHTLSNWSFVSFEHAFNFGAQAMFTGLHVGPFENSSKIKKRNLSYSTFSLLNNSLPQIILNTHSYKQRPDLPGRDSLIFTRSAQQLIKNHNRIPALFNKVPIDMYSYKINCCDTFNIPYESPFLNKELINIAYSLPHSYKNVIHGNYIINKIALRYSMLNKLPQKVVGHCYPANLNYIFGHNIYKNYDQVLEYFDESKYLIRNDIIDLNNLRAIRKNKDAIYKASGSIQIACSVQYWLDNYNKELCC